MQNWKKALDSRHLAINLCINKNFNSYYKINLSCISLQSSVGNSLIKEEMNLGSFRDLIVYRKAFKLAMDIFDLTKNYPKEELYGLTIQIRKSSRSVCSSIGEAYRKRQYPAHFVSKLSDADMENSETQVWLDFSIACKYIDRKIYKDLNIHSEEIGKLLNYMIENPGKFD